MLRFVYMCPVCKRVYLQAKDFPGPCSDGHGLTVPLDYTSRGWGALTKAQRDAAKEGFHTPLKRALPVEEPEDWIYYLAGFGNELYVYPNRVVIGRRQFFLKGRYIFKSYPYSRISHVTYQQGSVTAEHGNGFLSIGVPGSERHFFGRLGSYMNETGVIFHALDNDVADEIRHYIESKIGVQEPPASSKPPFPKI